MSFSFDRCSCGRLNIHGATCVCESEPRHDGAVGDARKRAVADHCAHTCVYCGAEWRDAPEDWSYTVPDSPKMLRETLCVAQTAIGQVGSDGRTKAHIARLQRLIDECEQHRPTGSDGKHGYRHTPTCGCAPEGQPEGSSYNDPTGPGCACGYAAPAPVPDDEAVEALTNLLADHGAVRVDEQMGAEIILAAAEAHAAAVREAVRAHGELIAEAIEAYEDEHDSSWSKYGRHALVQAARIAREAVQ